MVSSQTASAPVLKTFMVFAPAPTLLMTINGKWWGGRGNQCRCIWQRRERSVEKKTTKKDTWEGLKLKLQRRGTGRGRVTVALYGSRAKCVQVSRSHQAILCCCCCLCCCARGALFSAFASELLCTFSGHHGWLSCPLHAGGFLEPLLWTCREEALIYGALEAALSAAPSESTAQTNKQTKQRGRLSAQSWSVKAMLSLTSILY